MKKPAMKICIVICLLITLNRSAYSAPIADKSVNDDQEIDSWLDDIEDALDKEIPSNANIQENSDERFTEEQAVDRYGYPVNREGPVDVADWAEDEEFEETNFGQELDEEVDGNVGYAMDNAEYEPTHNAMDQSMEQQMEAGPEQLQYEEDEYRARPEYSPQAQYWEGNNREYGETKVDTMTMPDDVKGDEMQELVEYADEPADDPWESSWDQQDKPVDMQEEQLLAEKQGYNMELPNNNYAQEQTFDDEKSWEEPSHKDFDDLRFDNELESNDAEETSEFKVIDQPIEAWEETQNSDVKLESDKDFYFAEDSAVNAKERPVDMELPAVNAELDDGDQQSWEVGYDNFDDLGVAEDMSINLDTAATDKSAPWDAVELDDQTASVQSDCITSLYIMAFTSGGKHDGSHSDHGVEIRANGHNYGALLPNLPGDDYLQNKGDLWKLDINGHFHISSCLTPDMVEYIAIEERSNDGWKIDSIATFYIFGQHGHRLATADLDVHYAIDGNGHYNARRLELTMMF